MVPVCLLIHGLRRGLHSFAALRLGRLIPPCSQGLKPGSNGGLDVGLKACSTRFSVYPVVSAFPATSNKVRGKVKSSGQECPLHTGSGDGPKVNSRFLTGPLAPFGMTKVNLCVFTRR
jgi:hypothetical protein